MLGKHADYFMAAQARERVVAVTPNGGGQGYNPPDQERSGTAHVKMRRGMNAPSSQTVVPSGALPGMGRLQIPRGQRTLHRSIRPSNSVLAGIQPSGALPGMGSWRQPSGALPGMGHYPLGRGSAGAVAGWRQPSGALPGMGDFTIAGYSGIAVLGAAAAAYFLFFRKPGRR